MRTGRGRASIFICRLAVVPQLIICLFPCFWPCVFDQGLSAVGRPGSVQGLTMAPASSAPERPISVLAHPVDCFSEFWTDLDGLIPKGAFGLPLHSADFSHAWCLGMLGRAR